MPREQDNPPLEIPQRINLLNQEVQSLAVILSRLSILGVGPSTLHASYNPIYREVETIKAKLLFDLINQA